MKTLRHDFNNVVNRRFDENEQALTEFCAITPQKKERLKVEQDRLAFDSLREGGDTRIDLLVGQLADCSLEGLRLITRLLESAQPIVARAQERLRLAEARVEEKKKECPTTYRCESYVDLMIIAELKCDLEEFYALLRGYSGDVQAALYEKHALISSAWRTRGNLDTVKASRKASESVGAVRIDVAAPFSGSSLPATFGTSLGASSNHLPPAAKNDDDPIEFYCIQGGLLK